MATFAPAVEQWRSYLERYGGASLGGLDFLLAWLTKESGGNPCSVGVPGVEAGLFQTWSPDDDVFGMTFAQLRAPCSGGSQTQTRPLTEDEIAGEINAGLNYVRNRIDRARDELGSVGANWSESSPDFGMFVKFIHGAGPAGSLGHLRSATANLGRPPSSFPEMAQATTQPDPHNTLGNAMDVGKFWTGTGLPIVKIALMVGLGYLAFALFQPRGNPARRRRRARRRR